MGGLVRTNQDYLYMYVCMYVCVCVCVCVYIYIYVLVKKEGFSCADFPPLALIPLIVPPSSISPGPGVKRCICNTRVTVGPRKLCLMRE
jgi:hypothetical protein